MPKTAKTLSKTEIHALEQACQRCKLLLENRFGGQPKAAVVTFGCQQNEADSELIRSMLLGMGCTLEADATNADILIFNTCAIREHAETRVFGNLGEASHLKNRNPKAIVCLCGCMAQQSHVADKVKASYPYVDMVFGTHALARFPMLLEGRLLGGKRAFDREGDEQGLIIEGVRPVREKKPQAWLSVMYGCNNFCSYCIVPHVRGRERSRSPEAVETEFKRLVDEGYKDITLLGQNVNSYGKDLGGETDFAALLQRLASVQGDFRIRFMTSHPKDASQRLFDVMAAHDKICISIHLPVQSGSDRVLQMMNRRYTAQDYLKLVEYARSVMPDITITSDIIVGFPGESEEDFEQTLDLLRLVRFDSLFTFIYSPRKGTKAAQMPDPISRQQKQVWFDRLLETQNLISREINDTYVGKSVRVLVNGPGEDKDYPMEGRTEGFKLVHIRCEPRLAGTFQDVEIEKRSTWALFGRVK